MDMMDANVINDLFKKDSGGQGQLTPVKYQWNPWSLSKSQRQAIEGGRSPPYSPPTPPLYPTQAPIGPEGEASREVK